MNGEVEYVNSWIQEGCLKWMRIPCALSNTKVPFKIKEFFLLYNNKTKNVVCNKYWIVKNQHKTKIGVAQRRMLC